MKTKITAIAAFLLVCCVSLCFAQEANFEGRIYQQEDKLYFCNKEGKTYLLLGGKFINELMDLVKKLGNNNVFAVSGAATRLPTTHCSTNINYDPEGNRSVKATCLVYSILTVNGILSSGTSDQEFPNPKRDTQEEQRIFNEISEDKRPSIMGEIEGVVTSLNIITPIKTVEVTDKIKNRKISMIINPDTLIYKTVDEKSTRVSENSLRMGQRVVAVYSRSQTKTEAKAITLKD